MRCTSGSCPMGTSRLVSVSVLYICVQSCVIEVRLRIDIADVTRFVQPETPMDADAAERGATVYLVNKTIHMLPELLSIDLCSLRPHVERLAFSVIWVSRGQFNDHFLKLNIIHTGDDTRCGDNGRPLHEICGYVKACLLLSRSSNTHRRQVLSSLPPQSMYCSMYVLCRTLNDDVTQSIRLLNDLAKKLKSQRMAMGAIAFASPDVKVELDTAGPAGEISLEPKELLDTNQLIEELMLLANISVARKIQEAFPGTAVLR